MSDNLLDSIRVFSVLLLVALNAFFVAAEYSLVAVRRTRVELLVSRGRFGAAAVREAKRRLDESIAVSQLGVTIASLALGWVGEPALAHLLHPLFVAIPGPWSAAVTHAAAVTLAFLVITYLHVVLGELAPKALALQRTEDVALAVAGILLTFARVLRPLSAATRHSGSWVLRQLRLPPLKPGQSVHSVDELRMLVEETERAGGMPEDEARYVRNVFRLSDKKVRDVMVPSDKVVTLSLGASEEEVLETARDSAHTRMPVWGATRDDIVGTVNTKDLFHLFSLKGLVILEDAMYPAIFVHPEQPVARLLRTFKREKRQMAVVQGDDGRFLGIVTLEDILEEIVGEIEDEHDDPPGRLEEPGQPAGIATRT